MKCDGRHCLSCRRCSRRVASRVWRRREGGNQRDKGRTFYEVALPAFRHRAALHNHSATWLSIYRFLKSGLILAVATTRDRDVCRLMLTGCTSHHLHLIDDETEPYFVTTIAQLVFFQWAHSIGVIAYAEKHVRHIEDDLRSYRASSSDLHSRSSSLASKALSEPHSVWPDSKTAVGATVMVRGDVSISFV